MTGKRERWYDEAAGPLVRPYAVTRGRARAPGHELDLITLVVATRSDYGLSRVEPEYSDIVRLCQLPLSIAEIAAKMHFPLGVTKILVSDLIDESYLIFRSPPPLSGPVGSRNIDLLRAVLDGLHKL